MGYRTLDIPPLKPEDMLPMFEVRNGAIVDIAFPCFYLDVVRAHDSHYHDYINWPAPNYHPGPPCQFVDGIPLNEHAGEYEKVDFLNPHPIDLLSYYEGYTDAYVVMDQDVAGLTVTARIDEDEPNVIYVRAKANMAFFEDKPLEYRFTLFVHAPARTYHDEPQLERIDQVIRGKIVVLPGNVN